MDKWGVSDLWGNVENQFDNNYVEFYSIYGKRMRGQRISGDLSLSRL
jgi:hypothetical protein